MRRLLLIVLSADALSDALLSAMNTAVHDQTGAAARLSPVPSRVRGGGGGANVGVVEDASTGARYFTKIAPLSSFPMLEAEYHGVQAIAATRTVRVPSPIAVGSTKTQAFLVLEVRRWLLSRATR